MARTSKKFVAPRGQDGKFLPVDQWPKSTQKEFERLKKNGAFKNQTKNPIVKSSSGRRSGKNIWIPPQDKATGRFLPSSEWSASEKRAYKKALKKGLVPGTLVPRGYAGRFASEQAPRPRRHTQETQLAIRPQDEGSDDLYEIRRGIRRLERRVEDLSYDIESSERRAERGRYRPSRYIRRMPSEISRDFEEEPIDADFEEVPCKSDPCQKRILKEIKDTGKTCELALADLENLYELSPNRSMTRNRAIRSIMYNRPKSIGRRFNEIIEYVKERPVLAIVGLGAIAVLGYALYRLIMSIRSTVSVGTEIRNGVMSFPGVPSYTLTQDDAVWCIRSIWGEVNRSNRDWNTSDVQKGAAAVLWSMANNYMTVGRKRQIFPTFGEFVQRYSQPINPVWLNPNGEMCQRSPNACTPEKIQFRQSLRSKPWSEFPPEAQALVHAFVNGTLRNPIGSRTDFSASWTGYRTADAINVAGNVFGTDPDARRRPGVAVA